MSIWFSGARYSFRAPSNQDAQTVRSSAVITLNHVLHLWELVNSTRPAGRNRRRSPGKLRNFSSSGGHILSPSPQPTPALRLPETMLALDKFGALLHLPAPERRRSARQPPTPTPQPPREVYEHSTGSRREKKHGVHVGDRGECLMDGCAD